MSKMYEGQAKLIKNYSNFETTASRKIYTWTEKEMSRSKEGEWILPETSEQM